MTTPNAGQNGRFGSAVAAEGTVVVVGAPLESPNGVFSTGAAYVFQFVNGVWNNGTPLLSLPNNLFLDDEYGSDVAISGDIIAVSIPFDNHDMNITNGGAVFIYRRNDNGTPGDPSDDIWNQEDKLTASDAAPNDQFGESVACFGNTILVGSPFHDTGGVANAGQVYVFRKSGLAWVEDQILQASNIVDGNFGMDVALDATRAIIGHPGNDTAGPDRGAAFIYANSGATFAVAPVMLAVPASMDSGLLGTTVDISGDIAAMGSPASVSGLNTDGAAYVFRFDDAGNAWSSPFQLAQAQGGSTMFSHGIALFGTDAVVGANLGFADIAEVQWQRGSVFFYDSIEDCNGNGFLDFCEPTLPHSRTATGTAFRIVNRSRADHCPGDLPPYLDPYNFEHGIQEAAVSILNGKIYVSHGLLSAPPGFTTGPFFAYSAELSVYDIAANTWDYSKPVAPTGSGRRDVGGAVSITNQTHYVIGGVFGPGIQESVTDRVDVFNITTGTWSPSPMLIPLGGRAGVGCASWNDVIYIVGGRDLPGIGEGIILARVESYDAVANQWSTPAPLLVAVSDCSATVAYNGKIYVMGGVTSPPLLTQQNNPPPRPPLRLGVSAFNTPPIYTYNHQKPTNSPHFSPLQHAETPLPAQKRISPPPDK